MSQRKSTWGTLPANGTLLTTAEYLQTAESPRVQELAFGTLRVAESPTAGHQSLLLELAVTLREHVLQRRLGTIWIAPLDVILDPARALIDPGSADGLELTCRGRRKTPHPCNDRATSSRRSSGMASC